jgi:hypothetical protein
MTQHKEKQVPYTLLVTEDGEEILVSGAMPSRGGGTAKKKKAKAGKKGGKKKATKKAGKKAGGKKAKGKKVKVKARKR